MKLTLIVFFLFCALNANCQIITTIAGNGAITDTGDGGAATIAAINYPGYVTIDAAGNFYIAESYANHIRKVTSSGIITRIAGNGVFGYSGDGGQATAAAISNPTGVKIDIGGNIYIADAANNRIRKINTFGIITTIAGNGGVGDAGDGGPAILAQLNSPYSVDVDNTGAIYIADYSNHKIRKINSAGIISTVAGNGTIGFGGDGGAATSAQLDFPSDISVDNSGNIYIADYGNHRVRKVTAAGVISTFAGIGIPAFSGDGGLANAAKLWFPAGIDVDNSGNVFILDQQNQRIRKVNTSGVISTVAGSGVQGFGGDGGPATLAKFHLPTSIAVDNVGNLYVSDKGNMRIRKVTFPTTAVSEKINLLQPNIYPNPTNDILHIDNLQTPATYKLANMVGSIMQEGSLKKGSNSINIERLPAGVYMLELSGGDGIRNVTRVVKE